MIDWDPEAADEVDAAAEWYEKQRKGLSAGLFDELKKTLAAVDQRPQSFPRIQDVPDHVRLRRALLHRFPFAVVFIELPGDVRRVIAFAHGRRRPGYWLWRVV